jgi:SAM-dependent methyltransferase
MNVRTIFRELARGKGFGRTLMNLAISAEVELDGVVLDIGGKGKPSYRRFIKPSASGSFFVLDLIPDPTADVAGSAARLPIRSKSCDTILCFNVLEHVFQHASALSEIRRVLKPGGKVYAYVPFLVAVHADPYDYWRYTGATLEDVFKSAGFAAVSVETQGGLFLVIHDLLSPFWRLAPLRLLAGLGAVAIDRLHTAIVGQGRNGDRYALGYFISAH